MFLGESLFIIVILVLIALSAGIILDRRSKYTHAHAMHPIKVNDPKTFPFIHESDELWEILVPASTKDLEFPYDHHKKWDDFVKSIAGGLTVMRTVKGEWINPDGVLYKDRMIPVMIKCKFSDIKKIIKFTIEHYQQEAVLAYMVSADIILMHRDSL